MKTQTRWKPKEGVGLTNQYMKEEEIIEKINELKNIVVEYHRISQKNDSFISYYLIISIIENLTEEIRNNLNYGE